MKKQCSQISTMSFHEDGIMLATGHEDGSVNIWDTRSVEVIATFKAEEEKPITKVNFSLKGLKLVVLNGTNQVMQYNIKQ